MAPWSRDSRLAAFNRITRAMRQETGSRDLLESLVRSLPERSMRMQVRFEISEGTGDLISRYVRERRSESAVSVNSIVSMSSSGGAARIRWLLPAALSPFIFHLEPADPS